MACFALMLVMVLVLPMMAFADHHMMKVKKIDNFVIFVDQSGSMAEYAVKSDKKKITSALETVTRMDKMIPDLGYTGAMDLFAPFATVTNPAPYKPGALSSAAAGVKTDFSVFGRQTPMGDGLMKVDPVLGGLSGKTALIILTDGESNLGSDPVQEAKDLYTKYPNLCIHVISYADTARGQKIIDQIRALNGCTVAADAQSLATDDGLAKYVKDVFYTEAPAPVAAPPAPAPVPPPAPAPAPAPMKQKEVITLSLLFDFDKAVIKDEFIPVLEKAKMILNEDSAAAFTISGHTCNIGTDVYNQKLSERRAAAVKKWLVDNGVAASRLDAAGYGESTPKYDNNTQEGRKLNRRVEIQTK
jgi:OOP family OmpA-OmpF porin